jgi:heptaprenyl diphosphate synthase
MVLHTKFFRARSIALTGVLGALALALSYAELFLAPALPLGVKPGLSNIAVMLAGTALGLPAGLLIALMKAVFAGITRGQTAMLLSGAGGLLSALVAVLLLLEPRRRLSETGAGIAGGVVHNLAQLLLAAALTRTPGIFWSAPLLIVFGAAAGAITGTLTKQLRKSGLLQKNSPGNK